MITERQWQDQVEDTARRFGWWTKHNLDERRSTAGWPDLVLLRPPRLVFVELKTATGKLSKTQADILARLFASGQEIRVWRPAQFDDIVLDLRAKSATVVPGRCEYSLFNLAQEKVSSR